MSEHGLTAGVVGGAGYAGGDLCRLLLGHPAVTTVLPTSRGDEEFERVHPNLLGSGLSFLPPEELAERADELDVVFFSTPTGEAMRAARHFLDRGAKVVDLSADFRFADPEEYRRVHGPEHESPDLLAEAAYGATELFREDVAGARLVANPGCYAITALLALAPLADAGLLGPRVAVHAVNGTTGAGVKPKRALMHAEVAGALLAYGLDGHRHGPELEGLLARAAGHPVRVDLNTTHADFPRGIHLQANLDVPADVTRDRLLEVFQDFYGRGGGGEHFVRVNATPRRGGLNDKDYALYPLVTSVVGTNFCHLGVDVDPVRGIAKVVAVTDNLVKGAAGSAVQNMNVLLGLPETDGLLGYAC
ncbi:N-acetyl-gamma-glutamyl-phosphate reductase [Actinosynnema pretiosum]|uniref:N-acetyl-gamma-glutamyl-phosphate reductase n=1 Tax=Actinosynnema pretiosum TaxID=42197 RepID=A0A290Z6V1_9PSEU|nr:N-acetyl-gamma-glutamyl-phosphate reductase [Actinosynnema pretiosum]ATE54750.1 N-acetyl-gamma-glutamyl-phosphate reductase [Actinosynnema pretiosum]